MDEKSNPPSTLLLLLLPPTPCHSRGEAGGDKSIRRYKNKSCYLFFPSLSLLSMNQLVVMVCSHARVCAHMCVHYEADTSIIYSSALSARLPHCVFQHASQSLCHMHYLTHTRTPTLMQIATRAIYLGYAHLSPCLLLAPTVANDCTSPSPRIHLRRLIIRSHTSPARLS